MNKFTEEKDMIRRTFNENKSTNLAISTSLGLAIGAGIGIAVGTATNNLALWMSIGVGCGLAIGASIGALIDNQKNKKNLDLKLRKPNTDGMLKLIELSHFLQIAPNNLSIITLLVLFIFPIFNTGDIYYLVKPYF